MKVLSLNVLAKIAGGNPALVTITEAALIGVGVYTAPQVIYDATQFLNGVGQAVGSAIFDFTNPNAAGQTVYWADEFGYSYIAPAFPDSYFG